MKAFIDFYNKLFGFRPYDYQVKVAELLLQGKNVVISVPTGAGKTNASVAPFLYAIENEIVSIPHKMIYSLPLRTLSNSIYGDLKSAIEHSEFNRLKDLLSIQTGEVSDDPMFERSMIISTIDQTLSSFLCFPLSVSHSKANINAGALIGSYLIFDEFHLLDSKLSMATTLGMLRYLGNLSRFCIMTATLSDEFLNFLHTKFGFEIVSMSDFPNDISKIKSLKKSLDKDVKKSVTVVTDKLINAEDIIEKHSNKTIVICNRVETAQQLYEQIKTIKKQSTELICLHSRFFDSDRKRSELKIKECFGKKSDKQDVILISTQVIEAGMDISCDIMHTEISPINSFLQRAGRCARFENEYGQIYVYDVLDLDEKEKISESGLKDDDKSEVRRLNSKYLPYDKALCVCSLDKLSCVGYIDEYVSKKLVNDVLADEEASMINSMTANLFNQTQITASWNECDKKYYKNTIRDIQSVELVLIDLEDSTGIKYNPWQYETISVYRWSFINWAKKITEANTLDDDWVFAKAIQSTDSQFDFEWNEEKNYVLRQLSVDEMKNYYDIIFVDNRYFYYTADMGLIIRKNVEKKTSPLKSIQNVIKENISYKKDTLYEHSMGLVNCYENDFKKDVCFTLKHLSDFWKKDSPEEGVEWEWESLIKMMLCYHDFGKLNKKWQEPMLNYQRRKNNDKNYYEVLAHTDYDETVDKQLGNDCGLNRKPPHAGIGALQVYNIIYDTFNENEALARAVSNAILKHHSVDTIYFCDFEIKSSVINDFNGLLEKCGLRIEQLEDIREREDKIDLCETTRERIVYLFLVRILRLCDQRSTSNLEKYYKL